MTVPAEECQVVVLGHTGSVGLFLCEYLRFRGFKVLGASSRTCNLLDITQSRSFFEKLDPGCTIVFNSVINRWREDSFDAMTRNIAMAENVIQTAAGRFRSLVYLSTVDVYGTVPELPLSERTQVLPGSYYSIGKLASERLLAKRCQSAIPLSILRLPGVYGTHLEERSILAHFFRQIREGAPVKVFGDGSVQRDFVLVDDVCEIIHQLVMKPMSLTVNVATGRSLPLLEILQVLGRVLDRKPEIHFGPHNWDSAGDLIFDTSRLVTAFPSFRSTSLEEGCRIFAARS